MSDDPVARFLAAYPPHLATLAIELRKLILGSLSGVEELIDYPAKMVGYVYGPGYAGMVCTIIPSKAGVKLGLPDGQTFPDPDGLLQGTGKRHRYVELSRGGPFPTQAIESLLCMSRKAQQERTSRLRDRRRA